MNRDEETAPEFFPTRLRIFQNLHSLQTEGPKTDENGFFFPAAPGSPNDGYHSVQQTRPRSA